MCVVAATAAPPTNCLPSIKNHPTERPGKFLVDPANIQRCPYDPLWRLSHGWPRSECHIWNSKYNFSSGQAIPCTHIPDPSAVVDLCMPWVQSMGIACSNWAPHPRLVLVLWTSSAAIFPEHAAVQRHILLWKFVTSSNFPKWSWGIGLTDFMHDMPVAKKFGLAWEIIQPCSRVQHRRLSQRSVCCFNHCTRMYEVHPHPSELFPSFGCLFRSHSSHSHLGEDPIPQLKVPWLWEMSHLCHKNIPFRWSKKEWIMKPPMVLLSSLLKVLEG